MRTARFLLAVGFVALIAICDAVVLAVEKAPAYDTFRLVKTRNMFDPNRRPVRTEPPPAQRSAPGPQRPRSSALALTGTMVTEGRSLAFFTGDRSDYNKVVAVGDTVADCKITAIKAQQVEMDRGGNATVLAVGSRLQIEGAAPDAPAPEEAPAAAAPETPGTPPDPNAPPPAATAAPAPASTSSPASNDPKEILRRMMERREKEMSK